MHKDGLIGEIRDKMQQSTAAPKNSSGVEMPRPHPEGIRNVIYNEEQGRVYFELKTVIRFWWALGPAITGIFGLLCFFFLSPAIAIGVVDWGERPNFFLWFAIIGAAALTIFIWSIRTTRPWITIRGNQEQIIVEGPRKRQTFDRKHFGGMQTGYSIQTESGALVSDMTEPRFGMTLLRLTYGPWGEDLPYMVNSYHANELVIWMNMALGVGEVTEPKAHAPELGIVEEVF